MALEGGTIADTAVEVVADTGRFEPDVRRKLGDAGAAGGRAFDRALQRQVAGTGRAVGDRVARDASGGARQAGISWGDAFRIGIAARLTRTQIRQLMLPFTALAGTLAFSVVSSGSVAAAAGLVVFAAELANAGGAALALPAALLVGAAAVGVLAVAFSGMQDALSAALVGDARKFAEATEDMAPPAAAVAREFRDLVPQLDAVREAVQIAFWERLQGQLTAVAAVLLGPVGQGMTLVAGSSAAVALGIAQIAQEAETARLLAAVFDTTATSVDAVNPAVLAVVRGLRDLAGVGLPLMEQLSGSVGGLGVQFGEWLSRVSASGQAWAWIQNAMATLGQLGNVLLQIGGILGSVFRAAEAASGGLLGNLERLLTGVNDFLSSAQGQQVLVTIFASLSQVGGALLPVLIALGSAVALIAPQLAGIAVALGPALVGAVSALGPALAAVGPGLRQLAEGLAAAFADPAMAEGLLNLGNALSETLVALVPLLPPLGQLVVLIANVLARALMLVAPLVRLVAVALAFLLPPVLSVIDAAYGFAFAMGRWLEFTAIPGILSGIGSAAQAVARFFVGLWNAASSIDLGSVVASIGSFVAGVLGWFARLPAQAGAFLADLGTTVLGFFVSLPGLVVQGLAALPGLLLDGLVLAAEAVGYGIGLIIALVIGLPVLLYNALVGLGQLIYNALVAAWQWGVNATITGVEAVVSFAVSLPGRVVAGVVALGAMLAGWATAAWAAASGAFTAGVNAVVSFALSLPGRVVAAVAALGGMLSGWASSAWSSATGAFVAGVNSIVSYAQSLPGRIVSAIGNLGSMLFNAGREIINGLLNGIKAAAQDVFNFVSGIGDRIASLKGPLPRDRVLLTPHGKAIMTGLDRGIRSEFGTVRATLRELTADLPRMAVTVKTSRAPAAQPTATRNGIALTPSLVPRPGQTQVVNNHTEINAPITVQAPYSDPELVALSTVDRLMRAAAI
ncbi:hypothetical protein [Saccharothrix sp. HUAS TT1]|uniref:phage tail protein n=1 Tax=unclassified Saccharothrix TaxID=2593673 RepID=UPI00345BDDF4